MAYNLMRKTILNRWQLLCVVAAIVCGACSDEASLSTQQKLSHREMRFGIGGISIEAYTTPNGTRSADTDVQDQSIAASDMGLFVMESGGYSSIVDDGAWQEVYPYFYDNMRATISSRTVTPDATVFYPLDSKLAMAVMAYAPYRADYTIDGLTSGVKLEVETNQSSDSAVVRSDMLVGVPESGNPFAQNDEVNTLSFRHLFSRIVVRLAIEASEQLISDYVEVQIDNAPTQCTAPLGRALVSSQDVFDNATDVETSSVTMAKLPGITAEEIAASTDGYVYRTCSAIILPDSPEGHDMAFSAHFFNSSDIELCQLSRNDTSATTLRPGCSYNYTMRVPASDVERLHKGHSFVDLGLPSGTLWATTNVGASRASDAGSYFSWGETSEGHYTESTNVAMGKTPSQLKKEGIVSSANTLADGYDAARETWGGNWRMPTSTELQELIDNCTWTHTVINGVGGYNVEGPSGESIFIPSSGRKSGSAHQVSAYGYIWTSTPTSTTNKARSLFFTDSSYSLFDAYRYYGLPIRPVIGQ